MFGVKDAIPGRLRLCVDYKFACAGCSACYVGETVRHFHTKSGLLCTCITKDDRSFSRNLYYKLKHFVVLHLYATFN